jgi:hypothetical protein
MIGKKSLKRLMEKPLSCRQETKKTPNALFGTIGACLEMTRTVNITLW